jgi:AcrR family transcriptional regulator
MAVAQHRASRAPGRSRRGRPARVDADAIADAVLQIGVDEATIDRVAERLGLSVPGLYHHVRGRDDLLRLAAQRAMSRSDPPVYAGEHWSDWLVRCARFIRSAFASQPALLEQFVAGSIDDDTQLSAIDTSLDILCQHGFTPDQALSAWAAVTDMALGSAVEQVRERRKIAEGRSWPVRILAASGRRVTSKFAVLPTVASLDPYSDDSFEGRLTLLVSGIAARCGFDLRDDAR